MIYVITDGNLFINVDNEVDFNRYKSEGWKRLTDKEISACGMEGYEHYVSPLNTKYENGKIIFTPPTKEELIERAAAPIREQRDDMLAMIGGYVMNNLDMPAEKLAEISAYRKALMAIEEQEGFPDNVVWPECPVKFE